MLAEFDKLRAQMPAFDRVSVGFPGVIKHGKTFTAANLDPSWVGFALQETLEKQWKKPVRVCNDAAVQGYAAVQGKDVELILTLGPASDRRSLPAAISVPAWNWRTISGARKTAPTRITSASAALRNTAPKDGMRWFRKRSKAPASCSTGTPSTSAAATPRRSRSSCRKRENCLQRRRFARRRRFVER